MTPSAPLDTDVAIETPEHVVFRHQVAGPGRRLSAYVVDLFLCYGVFVAVAAVVLVATVGAFSAKNEARALENAPGFGVGLLLVLLFAVQWVYFAALEGAFGATPGKRLLRCRVVTISGRPVGFPAAVLRNVLRAADALPVTYTAGLLSIAGFASMMATRRFQRLGDLVAGTMVVAVARPPVAQPILLSPPASEAELSGLPPDVRLDAEERHALELFLRRRAHLGPAREAELAQMLTPVIEAHFGTTAIAPARALALLYDRAAAAGRRTASPSSTPPRRPWT